VNEAALLAARQNRKVITMADFELAKDKVMMGVERKSRVISDDERKHTAYHEAGHAVVASLVAHADPLHKVSIIPRGMALGVTMQLPVQDRVDFTKEQAEARLTVLMGGRVADETFMAMKSAGASNDIEQATNLARRMVCEWGMSEMGPVSYGKREEQIFLGREISQHRDYSETTAISIDQQVRSLIEGGYSRAKKIIDDYRDATVLIAETLLEREVLDGNEVRILIDGGTLPVFKPVTPVNHSNDQGQQVQQVIRPAITPPPMAGPQPA